MPESVGEVVRDDVQVSLSQERDADEDDSSGPKSLACCALARDGSLEERRGEYEYASAGYLPGAAA